jgi:hypothetical protein
MKFLAAFLLTALVAFIAGLQLPWWSIAIVSFLVALLIRQRAGRAFLAGFLGVFVLWCILSWWIDTKNESILSSRIGLLLGVGQHPFLLILITGVVGGLVAGLAALSGSFLRSRG